MKSLWNSFKAAFAMFSKIPMPMVDWKKENIKYMMCFFPFVGTAIGILTWLAGGVLGVHVALEPFFLAVILTVIPVFITGGIHVDGLLDTSDALSSWQERTRRLEILKDSHAGAFAIITACVYFILWLGAWDQLLGNYNGICIMSLGFMMSRCLSGIGVITFPKARTDGTVAEFSRNASEIVVRNVLITMFVILAALMIWVDPVLGVLAAVSALLVFWWYHYMAAYAKAQFPDVDWKFGGEITEEELLKAAGVLGFQEYIRKALKAGEDLTGLAEKLAQQDPDVILVSEEVGYGIVPADAFERQYREAVGRVCTALAAKSRRVTRVVCGIGTVLKDD